ncbi:hypothetical protein YWIDRAFT_05953 [Streptomyces sp. SceaMP-e96]|uniref:hypothetical protein n=1 Tax=Streptomyces TaxID=1883 RepID=UPI0008239C0E|nr:MULTISPECIES: hypothetical protein [unclassified Streptomyces]SCK32435.1 hypothetical protein YWIDRAFT_05953 [Streptomyces sp. SceaMP-e96]
MIADLLQVPDELSARVPAEQRGPGLGRDAVRLLVSRDAAGPGGPGGPRERTAVLRRAYAAAVRGRYLWHEFGDLHLVLPD